MGIFSKRNKCMILSADDFLYLYDTFGAEVAKNILRSVQEGKMSSKVLNQYLYRDTE